MDKINFEVGELVTPAKVNNDGTITPAVRKGTTPLSPFLLNQIQENVEKDQTRQDNEMTNMQSKIIKVLQEIETPTPVSGETIDITDSAEMRFSEFNVRGNSWQETVTDNLFNNTWEQGAIDPTTGENVGSTDYVRTGYIEIHPNHLYEMSRSICNEYMVFRFYDKDKNYIGHQGTENIMTTSNTSNRMGKNEDSITFTILNTEVSYMKISDFSNDLSTKYTLTTEAINPDYPSEVESCGDNVNLFDINNLSIKGTNGIASTNSENNILTLVSKSSFTYAFNGYILSNLNIGQSYTVSFDYTTTAPSTRFLVRGYKGETSTLIENIVTDKANGKIELTFNTSSSHDIYVLELYVTTDKTEGYIATFSNIKLEKGKKASGYSPYGQGCINEVVCNKNLFDEEIESGNINSSGVNYADSTMIRSKNYIKVNPNENIIISNNGIALQVNIVEYDKDYTFISRKYVNATYLTTSNNTKYIKFVTSTITEPKIQVEKNVIVTQYVEHQSQTFTIPTQQPMRSIGDIRDTFVKVDGKWVEKHYINRYVFTGDEDWKIIRMVGNYTQFRTGLNFLDVLVTSNIWANANQQYFSHFLVKDINTIEDYVATITGNKEIGFNHTLSTVNEWKAWMKAQYNAGTPVYIDYILKTPNDIECTEEQTTILDEIENTVKSYKGGTHIYSTDEVGPDVEVTYKKDIETLFNALAGSGV